MFVSDMVAMRDVALSDATASTLQDDSTPRGTVDNYEITHFDNNPHAAILEQADLRSRAEDDIGLFCSCLTQSSEQVITSAPNIL